MAKIYYDKDADLSYVNGKVVGIIGYGIQGRGQSLNLRDSGVKVIVSEIPGTPNYTTAKKDGFDPTSAQELAKEADIIFVLTQDPLQADIYKKHIAPNLNKGKSLGFSHGFNIHFKQIVPPKFVDVFMVAPKGPGSLVRKLYEEKKGVPCFIAIYQDASKQCKKIALAYAKALGGTRAGVIETTFKEETETDLFGEQAVLCGGVSELIKAGFETLVNAGYQPEVAYFECLHEMKLIVDLIYRGGLSYMRYSVSDTAEQGDYHAGPRIVTAQTREAMKKLLAEIRDGSFAKAWIEENEKGCPNFLAKRKAEQQSHLEQLGPKLRSMMPFLHPILAPGVAEAAASAKK
jgi:ketol-acid reductoisomerase